MARPSEEQQRALAGLARRHALALRGQALGDPGRQLRALDGVDLDGRARALQRRKPGRTARGLVQARQHDEREHAVVAGRCGGDLLQRGAAVLARLARGHANFDDLLVGKQAQRAAGGQHGAPVVVGAGHGEAAALGKALRARGGANGIQRLLRQQRLVAVQHVQRAQRLLQVRGQLGGAQLHVRTPATCAGETPMGISMAHAVASHPQRIKQAQISPVQPRKGRPAARAASPFPRAA